MKARIRKLNSGMLIFGLMVLLILVDCSGRSSVYNPMDTPLYKQLTDRAMAKVSDSLPAYRYNRIRDSLKVKIVNENTDIIHLGDSRAFASIGTSIIKHEDNEEYFLNFSGYETEVLNYHFRENGKVYFHYLNASNDIRQEESAIRFVREQGEQEKGRVLIPASPGVINTLNFLYPVILLIIVALFYYVLLVTPFRILYNIAKGQAFTDENIGGLHVLAWVLIILGLLPGLISIVSHLIIRSQIPEQIHFAYFKMLMQGRMCMVTGLGILILAKAFLRGAQLQKEQELTV